MKFEEYFNPIDIDALGLVVNHHQRRLSQTILTYCTEESFPALENIDIAIIGVMEERNAFNNSGCSLAPNQIRKYLYNLFPHPKEARIADCGNLIIGSQIEDTYTALADVVAELLHLRIIPIILGGSQDITLANYRGYENIGHIINAFTIDSSIDISADSEEFNSKAYITSMLCREPNYMFNYTHVGYQEYFVERDVLGLMDKLYFECYRVGAIQENLDNVEPLVRNADMISVDVSAVRQSDAPANGNPSPHGLYGQELCKLVRYAGMSDKCSSIGFYEMNPLFDNNGQTAHMVAHAIWYFIDGFLWRKKDFPYKEKESYKKYFVSINDDSHTIVFYKSKKSERWWMEVPCSKDKMIKYERHYLIPCSYQDYQTALDNEMPDRWLMAYNKIMI